MNSEVNQELQAIRNAIRALAAENGLSTRIESILKEPAAQFPKEEWVRVEDRLPTAEDADTHGKVWAHRIKDNTVVERLWITVGEREHGIFSAWRRKERCPAPPSNPLKKD